MFAPLFTGRRAGTAALVAMTLFLSGLLATPAKADSPLSAVPADAQLVIQVRGWDNTYARLSRLLKIAVPDFANDILSPLSEMEFANFKGADPKGPWFIVFKELPASLEMPEEGVAILVKTNNFDAFKGSVRVPVKKKGDFAVVSPDEDYADEVVDSMTGIDSKLSKELVARLLGHDVSVYVDMPAVNLAFGPTVQAMAFLFENMAGQGAGVPGVDENSMAMVKSMITALLQGMADGESGVGSLDFEPNGLALHLGVQFTQGSKSQNFLSNLKTEDMSVLSDLPGGKVSYSAMKFDPASFESLVPLMQGVGFGGLSAEASRMLVDAAPERVLVVNESQFNSVAAWICKDAQKTTDAMLKNFESIQQGGKFQTMAIKNSRIKQLAEAHKGFDLHYVQMDYDFEALAADVPGGEQIVQMMKIQMGEGIRIWFGSKGDTFVQLTGKDWNSARRSLDEFLDKNDPVGREDAFAAARKMLPKSTTMITMLNVPNLARLVAQSMSATFSMMGMEAPELPDPAKSKVDYLGFSLSLEGKQGAVDVWIPATAAQEFQKVFAPLIELLGQMGGLG